MITPLNEKLLVRIVKVVSCKRVLQGAGLMMYKYKKWFWNMQVIDRFFFCTLRSGGRRGDFRMVGLGT